MVDEIRHNAELTEAFEALVQAHRAALSRLARRVSRDPEEAEDLLQETLVDAYRGFHRFRPESQFYSWVARIMSNNELDRARRRRLATVSLDQPLSDDGPEPLHLPDESANPERLILHEQMEPCYQSALEALLPAQRATVLLCDIDGATYEDALESVDALCTPEGEVEYLRGRRIVGEDVHGTGCALSTAVATHLALGQPLGAACRAAKEFVAKCIGASVRSGQGAPSVL